MNDDALFTRQRRNLFLISICLALAVYFDLKLSKLNFLGNDFIMSSPRSVQPILWVFWAYFLFRFWQVFSWKVVRNEFETHFKRRLIAEAWEIARGARSGHELIPLKAFAPAGSSNPLQETFDHEFLVMLPDKAIVTILFVDEKIGSVDIGVHMGHVGHAHLDIPVEGKRFLRAKRRALMTAQFNTPVFTEHLFPFVVAVFPVIVLGVRLWLSCAR